MIRKHTRRAAKAAFAVSLGVAIVLGGLAGTARPATKSGPTIVIGTKDFGEEYILGELYKQALQAKGFTVLNPTPFYDTDVIAVTNATAKKYGLKTISDLAKVGSYKFAGFPECKTRNTCLVGYKKQYGIGNPTFVPLASISAYSLLDNGTVQAADVFSTDPPLGPGSKYKVLSDPKHVTGFQNVVPIVKTSIAQAGGATFTSTVNAVSAKLSQNAMVAMNKAFYVDKQSAKSIAKAFLKANGLI